MTTTGICWQLKLVFVAIFSLFMFARMRATAQTSLPAWGPYVNVQAGWAAGSSSSGFLGVAAAGVRYRRWGFGLASGIDNDAITSVPFLLDVRWAIVPGRRHTVEFFSQQGWNKVTQGSTEYIKAVYSGGPFWYGGLSCKLFSTSKSTGFYLSAGASYKHYRVQHIYNYYDFPANYLAPSIPGPMMLRPEPMPAGTVHQEWRGVLTLGWGWR